MYRYAIGIKFKYFYEQIDIEWILRFIFPFRKLGTHGSPRRRGNGHDPPVKTLGLGDVKRFIGGMHNTDSITGELFHYFYSSYGIECMDTPKNDLISM